MNSCTIFVKPLVAAVAAFTMLSAQAANFKVLHTFQASFGVNDGNNADTLIQPHGTTYYGTTLTGGPNFDGEVYKMSAAGVVKVMHAFDSTAYAPTGALVDGKDGFFYGVVTKGDVAHQSGAVFKISAAGVLTFIHVFATTEGAGPSPLVAGPDGYLYGTLSYGGPPTNSGVAYKLAHDGTFTKLHAFDNSNTWSNEGAPNNAGLTSTGDGNFFGVSRGSFINGIPIATGGVFRISSTGTFQIVRSQFYPSGPLYSAIDGNLYGTESTGGTSSVGTVFRIDRNGANYAVLHSFSGTADGGYPSAGVTFTNGNFYGTALTGGPNNGGTVFKVSPAGAFSLLHTFDPAGVTGGSPRATLMVNADGDLVGTTQANTSNGGVVYRQAP